MDGPAPLRLSWMLGSGSADEEKTRMKGVVLAGGLGTRLWPLTLVTNKHLLPIWKKPMIFYPIETLVQGGIDEILIITGGQSHGDLMRLLGDGSTFGPEIRFMYAYQKEERGIADALSLAERFAHGGKLVVILGDNIFEENMRNTINAYRVQGLGAAIMVAKTKDPHRFGVPRFADPEQPWRDRVVEIVKKPTDPPSQYAVTGLYFYDSRVFTIIAGLKPSARGELEITDVNNAYLKMGQLGCWMTEGWWTDAGTFETLLEANNLVAGKDRLQS